MTCVLLFGYSEAWGQDFTQYYVPSSPFPVETSPGVAVELPQESLPAYDFEIPSSIPVSKLRTIDGAILEGSGIKKEVFDPRYRCYRTGESVLGYMPGDGEQFGWVDFENTPYLSMSQTRGITFGSSLHLLSGPNSIPLPPRLWDFVWGYQSKGTLRDRFSYDVASSLGVYSDFEDSAKEGVRPLAHAVGSFHRSQAWDWVIGVDYVNRDDFKLLPVMGFSLHNPAGSPWRLDVIFPRPRIQYALSSSSRLYLAGLLGGGTWDVELPHEVDDVMTYRDYRLMIGHEQMTPDGNTAATEMGWIFNRQVDMRHSLQQVEFDDAFMIRFVARR